MHIALLTNEYPPHVYGGAGVHVAYLTREMARLCSPEDRISVLCFGDQNERQGPLRVRGVASRASIPAPGPGQGKVLQALARNLIMSGSLEDVDIVHCHTWYTHLAGCLIKSFCSAPLVLTTHSLEPHRPWKAAQLGSGYQASIWLERTAYELADGVVAVSQSMAKDVRTLYDLDKERIEIIPNGIDTAEYAPRHDREALKGLGIDPDRPYVLFVGRLTEQKGIFHLLRAIPSLRAGIQVVLCAASPDTPEIAKAMEQAEGDFGRDPDRQVIWIREVVDKERLIALYSQAAVFVCPSIYEPFGIINLEAMACGAPVVASAVGGIPEIVLPGETGYLVPFERSAADNPEPRRPEAFSSDLAQAVNRIVDHPELARFMAERGRQRARETFSWTAIASKTLDFYQRLAQGTKAKTSEDQNGLEGQTPD